MHRILSQDQSGGVYASTSTVHWRAEAEHEPDGEYLTAFDRQVPGGFLGVTANFARIDLYACNNTNPQKRAGP